MRVEISLLGDFTVRISGEPVPASAWNRRYAASLVKILALEPRRRLHRERLMNALWPDLPVAEAGPRLHKATHFARRSLGPEGIVVRGDMILLFPDVPVTVDVLRFQELVADALDAGDADSAGKAADAYPGPLLPGDEYEPWTAEIRDRLRLRHLRMLRQARRWAELAESDPTDGEAHLERMRELVAAGDPRAALRQFERMDRALRQELGVGPSEEAVRLRNSLLDTRQGQSPPSPLVGRNAQTAALDNTFAESTRGRGRTVFLSGAPGMGKSRFLEWAHDLAAARGWRSGHGAASRIEGAWPYAPVLEALADLCRRHPTLLDGLDDRCRKDIDQALSGRAPDWSGGGGHQRLFVAVAELVRLAAAGPGLLLTVDDVHEADEASLRLLHYLSRCCLNERFVLVLAHRRQPVSDTFEQVRTSLLSRAGTLEITLGALERAEAAALARAVRPDLAPDEVERIWELSGGMPFAAAELARMAGTPQADGRGAGSAVLAVLAPQVRAVLEHVATAGATFDTDTFLALAGLEEQEAFDCLDAALATLIVERTMDGYRFRHPLIRDALLGDIPPHRGRALHRACAQRLVAMNASPARIGHHLLAAGDLEAAVPYVLRAAETEAAVGAYRDALALVESVRAVATSTDQARVLALRADLLTAVGDPLAITAYREAIRATGGDTHRALRAKLARIAVYYGDLDTATAALNGLETDGGPADAAILLARGTVAYFTGDLDGAWEAASAAGLAEAAVWEQPDLTALKSLITHNRGEWSQMLRSELLRTRKDPALATMVFDSHLCVAEYLLYGPSPYPEVIELARNLRVTAERAGALRAVAFAGALIGEAALLYGDLDLAERELADAADLHREIGATTGEAHSLQRLAEVRLARDDRPAADRLLRRALPLARWSLLANHLLQRLYGTMILAAPDPDAARAVVDTAEAALGQSDFCHFCTVMFEVPAVIACAGAGDLAEARRHLKIAERSAALWDGTAWQAAMLEARAHLARAEGDPAEAARLFTRASALFAESSHPLDAERCRTAARTP
ncbi:AAA family ATPase [Microbispora sp. NPDC046933]|uniref:ATP-binding protein n=1 Tax=Microbispora sp. NPDC046933 TaxID=3155618 RepID=UPI0033C5F4BB